MEEPLGFLRTKGLGVMAEGIDFGLTISIIKSNEEVKEAIANGHLDLVVGSKLIIYTNEGPKDYFIPLDVLTDLVNIFGTLEDNFVSDVNKMVVEWLNDENNPYRQDLQEGGYI